ncbi:MAG: response regulator transcription factor [Campylobacteraceae bacterium]|nr:response regulator transcription factor [Campylobacteraceae bacterium]
MHILLLEDDLLLNEIIEEHLIESSHNVVSVYNGIDAEEELYSKKFDLLLLDVNVPGINGFELLKELREKEIYTPAIFLTSLNMVEDVEKGFLSGCDDYIKKPFDLKELDLRINNIKRIFKIAQNKNLELSNNLFFDKKNLLIIKNEEELKISQKESEVLEYLINNKNKIVSVDELSLNVWSYEDSPSAPTIRTYIKNIRKILGQEHVINIRGVGYKFN